MKKNILYLIFAGCSLFMGACNDDDAQYLPPVELQLTTSSVEFKSVGGEGTIEVGSADQSLKATSSTEWCTIDGCSQGVVNFTITPNIEMETRTAVITLTMGESSAKVGITQMGIITSYENTSFFSFGENKGFKQFIRFESEMPVVVNIDEATASWLSYEEAPGGFYIIGTDNTESLERLGKLTLESGSMIREYQFMQFSKSSYNRAWKANYKAQDGIPAEDEISIVPNGEEATIAFKKNAISFKGTLKEDKLSVACGQYLTRMGAYKIYLGVIFEDNSWSIDPELNIQLLPTMLEDGNWALTPQINQKDGLSMKNIAMLAVDEQDKVAGPMELFTNLTLTPNGEAQELIKTYKLTFTSAQGADYGHNDGITFTDGTHTLALDIYGEDYKYTKSGTYVVGASEGYYIDKNLSYTYFQVDGTTLALQSGEMELNANLETQQYEIIMNFILEDGSKVEATYTGKIEGDGFAIYDELLIDVKKVDQLQRRLPNGAVDGQFYLKIALNDWNVEMTLDLRANPEEKTILPEGIYNVGDSNNANILHNKNSDLTIFRKTHKFQSGHIKVTKADKIYTFELDVTDTEGQRYVGTISGEVQDMENPQ